MEPTTPDLLRSFLKQMLPAGLSDGSVQAVPGVSAFSSYTTETLFANGTVTAPVVGNDIATIVTLTGLYEVSVQGMYTGTAPAAAEINNFMFVAATSKFRLIIPPVLNTPSDWFKYRIRLNAQSIRVRAFQTPTATVDYSAIILADKIAN